jgi:protein SCO1/2
MSFMLSWYGCLLLAGSLGEPSRLPVIDTMPSFELVDAAEMPVRSSQLRGEVLLVGFVFTTCNGSCPATTHRMAKIHDALKERGLLKEGVRFLSITLDPDRDQPAKLRDYMRLYDLDAPSWQFLTGPPAEVKKVHAAWGMWAKPAANGQLDHPSRVYLVDRQGRIREIYNLEFLRVPWVVEDIRMLLDERSGAD